MPAQPQDYQTLFDIIRPRSEAPLWMLWVFLAFLALVALLVYGGMRKQRRREAAHLRKTFDNLAKERGLDRTETQMLWHLAITGKCEYPLLIFSSIDTFGRCADAVPPNARDEDRLVILRHKLGFHILPLGHTLKHTRNIPSGQRLWVGFKRDGHTRFCRCVLVENESESLLVAPLLRDDEDAFRPVQTQEILYVRFWRRGDSEYQFRSHLLPGSDPHRATLKLAHAEALHRVQHRDFFRLPVHIPVAVHDVAEEETAAYPPQELSLRSDPVRAQGWLSDLSAGGAALHISAALARGAYVWIDPLGETPFSLSGVSAQVLDVTRIGEHEYRHRLEFQNLNEVRQDALARQIHHAQIPSPAGSP